MNPLSQEPYSLLFPHVRLMNSRYHSVIGDYQKIQPHPYKILGNQRPPLDSEWYAMSQYLRLSTILWMR